jgi:hypothetical protein
VSLLLFSRGRMAILDDRHEPRLHIYAAQAVKSTKRSKKRLLDDIICIARRPAQPPCKAIGGVKMGHDQGLEALAMVIHGAG